MDVALDVDVDAVAEAVADAVVEAAAVVVAVIVATAPNALVSRILERTDVLAVLITEPGYKNNT